MKVSRDQKFEPITIILETEKEAALLQTLLGRVACGETGYDLYTLFTLMKSMGVSSDADRYLQDASLVVAFK